MNSNQLFTFFKKEYSLHQLLNIEEIQQFQELMSETNGIATVLITQNGAPFTNASNSLPVFSALFPKTSRTLHAGFSFSKEKENDEIIIQTCLNNGFWEAEIPVFIGNVKVAIWLVGQVKNSECLLEPVLDFVNKTTVNKAEIISMYENMQGLSAEKFKKIVELFSLFIRQVSEKAYRKIESEQSKEIYISENIPEITQNSE